MTTFYPNDDDVEGSEPQARLEILYEAAERYKAAILDVVASTVNLTDAVDGSKRRMTPKEMKVAYNWQEIAKLMREIREMPEANPEAKKTKAQYLTRLAEIYEALRAAKMPKLEAVRMALMNEAKQLNSGLTP
ncbi:MAG: hypothetical protein P4M12_01410 [Gammaproteobacteria bacterium]|nr:hypothetical protein [Gammaproteobacteria bacterium]